MSSTVTTSATPRTDWSLIWAQRGFRFFFFAMFISLFGSGMNFAGVSWYILAETHSTVKVSWQVIVATAPGLFVPFIGGVLIDRFDRRYLGVMLDFIRGIAVLGTAYVAWRGHLELWHLYAITLVTGVGSAMYWANVNSLVQEVIPASQFTGANAAVLIGVQTGMLFAGAFVGFIYDRAGIAGILGIDGLTYFVSAWCLFQMRRGYVSPREHLTKYPREFSEATESTAEALETGEIPEIAEAGLSLAVYSDLKEGFAYLKEQPVVRVLGITHSILMAGIVSANVLLVALAADVLHAGARGLGYLEGGWGLGAVIGGLLASQLPQRMRLTLYGLSIAGLAVGHIIMPFITFLVAAVFFQALFGFFRALSGVVAQATLMAIVPRHFMGRTQSAIAILTTILQVLMSLALGWVSQKFSLVTGFSLLALMYVGGTISAFRARQLIR
ncbi:MAG TPA: MFS transporter [Candidatus Sulfotelmatobacter sp.]|jgi:DHA3 family macrolide efflux protein-like MFS transporter|nr:MFS transporter [Candidatus Sulfotelmatobacter sp.]